METASIQYEALSPENIKELPGLIKEVFGISFSLPYFIKKYASKDLEKPWWGYFAKTNEGEYVGFCGALILHFEGNGNKYTGVQTVDASAKKKSRGQGILKNILNLIKEDCIKAGYDFMYAFPTPDSYHVTVNKMDYNAPVSIDLFRYPFKGLPIAKLVHRIPGISKLYNAYTNRILSGYDDKRKYFPNSVHTDSFIGVARTPAYLKQKAENGNRFIVVENTGIWVKCSSRLLVGDIEANPEIQPEKLLIALKKIALACGADRIDFKFSPGTFWYERLSKLIAPQDAHVVIFRPATTTLDWQQFKFTASDLDVF